MEASQIRHALPHEVIRLHGDYAINYAPRILRVVGLTHLSFSFFFRFVGLYRTSTRTRTSGYLHVLGFDSDARRA